MPKTSLLERDEAYRTEIVTRLLAGKTQQQIWKEVSDKGDKEGIFTGKVPDFRQFQEHIVAVQRSLKSESWSLTVQTAYQARLIMPVLAAIIERSDGQRLTLTQLEAAKVAMILDAASDIPPYWAYWLAHKYIDREERHIPTASLDALLAFTPWRDDKSFQRFIDVISGAHPEWLLGNRQGIMEGAVLDAIRIQSERTGERVEDILSRLRENLLQQQKGEANEKT